MSELWREHLAIQSARRQKMHEAMTEYDETVYLPALRDLIERCGNEGHVKGRFHITGFGRAYYSCQNCGTSINAEDTP